MAKHAYLHNQKRIVEADEFVNHLRDLADRIKGIDIRKMIANG